MRRSTLVILLGLILIFTLVSCGEPSVNAPDEASNHDEPALQAQSDDEHSQSELETADASEEDEIHPSDTASGMDDDAADIVSVSDEQSGVLLPADADAARGAVLFDTFQPEAGSKCSVCHRTDSDEKLIGPGLKTIGTRAASRVADMSAVDYIYESIVDPNAYVVEGYPNIMPRTWHQAFTDDELYDLIAYLMSLEDAE